MASPLSPLDIQRRLGAPADEGLAAISEQDPASGSDSDTSSVPERPVRPSSVALRLRLSAENTRMSDHSAVKSGYLIKKGERRKAWQKRWFVLRGGQVAMYKNDKEYRLLRLIPLHEIHACAPVELKKHPFTFGIVTPKRTYYVQATSEREVQEWCAMVEQAKEEVKASTTVTDSPRSEEAPGERTPVETRTSPLAMTAAISIPGASHAPPSALVGSYTTSATSSPPTPFSPNAPSLVSTSFTSTSTVPTASAPRVPPNSYAAGFATVPAGSLGLRSQDGAALELDSLDAGLEQIVRTASFSSQGDTSQGEGGYFTRAPRLAIRTTSTSGSTSDLPPPSPGGIISSSEDEEGFDPYEPWPSTSLPPALHASFPHEPALASQSSAEARVPPVASGSGVAAGLGDPNKVILSGYLMKQGKRRAWRKRWFVLMSGRLMYSRSHMDTKVHRQIPIVEILDAIEYTPVAPSPHMGFNRPASNSNMAASASPTVPSHSSDDGKRNYQHCFKIITPRRTYIVCAPSEEDEIKWLAALQCLVARKVAHTSINPTVPAQALVSVSRSNEINVLLAAVSDESRGLHGRQRSVTDAARAAVKDVEKRFHPSASPMTAS